MEVIGDTASIFYHCVSAMALYDHEAAGNAGKYLRLPETELLSIRNAPFEGKDAVWVPSKEHGYVKGICLGPGEKPGTRKVKTKEKEKDYHEDDVEPQNPSKYELIEDMANMTYLSEATVINNLHERYKRFLIYTYSGEFRSEFPRNYHTPSSSLFAVQRPLA